MYRICGSNARPNLVSFVAKMVSKFLNKTVFLDFIGIFIVVAPIEIIKNSFIHSFIHSLNFQMGM